VVMVENVDFKSRGVSERCRESEDAVEFGRRGIDCSVWQCKKRQTTFFSVTNYIERGREMYHKRPLTST